MLLTKGSSGYTSLADVCLHENVPAYLIGEKMNVIHIELLEFSERNIEHLRALIKRLCSARHEKQDAFAQAASWDKSDFSKWLNHEGKPINRERYYALLAFAAKNGRIPPPEHDPLSYAVSQFLEYPTIGRMERHSDFEGEYALYRYSFLAAGHILRGRLSITFNEEDVSFRVHETHRIQGEIFTHAESEEGTKIEPKIKPQDMLFDRRGLFFPRSEDSYLMITKKLGIRPVEIETTWFDNVHGGCHEHKRGEAGLLFGFVTDWHGKKFYSTRVVAQKLKERLSDDEILTLPPEKVNKIIRAYLEQPLNLIERYLVCFG